MKASFTIDVERDLRTGEYEGIEEGIPKILDILDFYKIKATLFVTGEILERYPQLFKKIREEDHEIEIHSYSHKRYDNMNTKQKEQDLDKCIKIFKKLFKTNPKGFRAPQHSIDNETLELLQKKKFVYDSSFCSGNIMILKHIFTKSSNLKNVTRILFSKQKPHYIKEKLIEIPRSGVLFSIGAFELKIFPRFIYKTIIAINKLFDIPLIFVMHSWDVIDIKNSRTSKMCKKEKFEKKLRDFLKYSSRKGDYQTISSILKLV